MTDFVAGDTGSSLIITCLNSSDSVPINLTGSTVTLKWGAFSKQMNIIDAVNGVAGYQFGAGELTAGQLSFEVEIVDSTGNLVSILDKLKLLVRAA